MKCLAQRHPLGVNRICLRCSPVRPVASLSKQGPAWAAATELAVPLSTGAAVPRGLVPVIWSRGGLMEFLEAGSFCGVSAGRAARCVTFLPRTQHRSLRSRPRAARGQKQLLPSGRGSGWKVPGMTQIAGRSCLPLARSKGLRVDSRMLLGVSVSYSPCSCSARCCLERGSGKPWSLSTARMLPRELSHPWGMCRPVLWGREPEVRGGPPSVLHP